MASNFIAFLTISLIGYATGSDPAVMQGPGKCPLNVVVRSPYHGDCTKYWECIAGENHLRSCPPKMEFTLKTKQCVAPNISGCHVISSTNGRRTTSETVTAITLTDSLPNNFTTSTNSWHSKSYTTASYSTEDYSTTTTESFISSTTPTIDCPIDTPKTIYFPYPGDCEQFYGCYRGQTYKFHCPKGLYWHQSITSCDWPENVDCSNDDSETSTAKPRICPKYSEDAIFLPDPEDCTRFYECYRGQQFSFTCPPVLYWNPAINQCDYPRNVDCVQPDTTTDSSSTATTSITTSTSYTSEVTDSSEKRVDTVCPMYTEEVIFVSDPKNCSNFWECYKSGQFHFNCPDELYWNSKVERCDTRENVNCTKPEPLFSTTTPLNMWTSDMETTSIGDQN